MEWIIIVGSFVVCEVVTLVLVRSFTLRKASGKKIALIGVAGNALSILVFALIGVLLGKGPPDARVFVITLAAVCLVASVLFVVGYIAARFILGAFLKREEEETPNEESEEDVA